MVKEVRWMDRLRNYKSDGSLSLVDSKEELCQDCNVEGVHEPLSCCGRRPVRYKQNTDNQHYSHLKINSK